MEYMVSIQVPLIKVSLVLLAYIVHPEKPFKVKLVISNSLFCYWFKGFSSSVALSRSLPSNLVENLTNVVLESVHSCKAQWQSLVFGSPKIKKDLKGQGPATVRFGKTFLNNWASKTYNDISKTTSIVRSYQPSIPEVRMTKTLQNRKILNANPDSVAFGIKKSRI